MSVKLLGISAYYHDSAVAMIEITQHGPEILFAAQEERFSRKKFDEAFPHRALQAGLKATGLRLSDFSSVVFYEKPWVTFERLLETYVSMAPQGLGSFLTAMPRWLHGKFNLKSTLRKELRKIDSQFSADILFSQHHLSHAAAAFYASPFSEAAVLCMDGVGEWATSTAWHGKNAELQPLWQIRFPHSLGLLYSAFTAFCGFKVNSGEYKLMGLAPFGEPRFVEQIKKELIDIKDDGSFRLNMKYFGYLSGLQMTNARFASLFGAEARSSEAPLREIDMDLAASVQKVTEDVILKLARTLKKQTGASKLCLAGGVALNCVANGILLREKIFDQVWIQPAAGDAGSALGAALAATYLHYQTPRLVTSKPDLMKGAYLGSSYSDQEICSSLEKASARFHLLNADEVLEKTSQLLASQKVVGWFQGKMEYGPRALGSRSILADARNREMQSQVNLKIKFREGFRPFAPLVLAEKTEQYFDLKQDSPYMLLVAPVAKERQKFPQGRRGLDKLKEPWSDLPAVTHVDHSARIQTVHQETNPLLHQLLSRFEAKTNCAVLLNTSFNVRGEPIVESPLDAFFCFMNTDIDALVIGSYLLLKEEQDPKLRDPNWRQRFELD